MTIPCKNANYNAEYKKTGIVSRNPASAGRQGRKGAIQKSKFKTT
jgi:hypothetical protein